MTISNGSSKLNQVDELEPVFQDHRNFMKQIFMSPLSYQADKRDFGKEDEVWQSGKKVEKSCKLCSSDGSLNPWLFWFGTSQPVKDSIHKSNRTAVWVSTQGHCLSPHDFITHANGSAFGPPYHVVKIKL
jgi:hypothetical protein